MSRMPRSRTETHDCGSETKRKCRCSCGGITSLDTVCEECDRPADEPCPQCGKDMTPICNHNQTPISNWDRRSRERTSQRRKKRRHSPDESPERRPKQTRTAKRKIKDLCGALGRVHWIRSREVVRGSPTAKNNPLLPYKNVR